MADAISMLPLEGHATPISIDMDEADLCELLCIYDLYFTDTVDAFSSTEEEIDFPLAPQLVEL